MQTFHSVLGRHYFNEPAITPEVQALIDAAVVKAKADAVKGLKTQDEVNAFLAKEKRTLRDELEKLKSAGDPEALTAKLAEMSATLATKEELAAQAALETKTKYDNALKVQADERAAWESRYKSTLFETEVQKAANKYNAFSGDQLGLLLRDNTKVVEKTDASGKGLNVFEVKTTINVEGKPLVLTLDEAVGKLREDKQFANQFKVAGSPGTGITLNNGPQGGLEAEGQPPTDPAAFIAWFSKGRANGTIKS